MEISSGPGLKSDDVEDAQHQATELRPDATRSIFVSPSGSDAGDGSAQHPLRSLRAAQTAARSAAAKRMAELTCAVARKRSCLRAISMPSVAQKSTYEKSVNPSIGAAAPIAPTTVAELVKSPGRKPGSA